MATEKRLIDANAFLRETFFQEGINPHEQLKKEIEKCPTVDAVEVADMTAAEKLMDAGYEDVVILESYSYDDALIGVTEDGRAVYDYDKMVFWLMNKENISQDEAMDWIEYNTIRALDYAGPDGPIIMYTL